MTEMIEAGDSLTVAMWLQTVQCSSRQVRLLITIRYQEVGGPAAPLRRCAQYCRQTVPSKTKQWIRVESGRDTLKFERDCVANVFRTTDDSRLLPPKRHIAGMPVDLPNE